MAAINDLIDRIENSELRDRLRDEVARLQKQKKFGLVFEEHIPEATPLYDVPIKKGSLVAARSGKIETTYRVLKVEGENLLCERLDETHEQLTLPKKDMVSIARFGEPIYPYLKPIDSVCNAPDSDLWHTLIEADNYHALQLLVYLYGGMVDCIYIDPPYNSGARDWKYNNDYVDGNDNYRHSKWLSMMQKRLVLAKKLLNPKDSVLIVTIDEKEYLHLGCLLEQIFPGANIQMITDVINPKGVSRGSLFSRAEEYIYYVFLGNSSITLGTNDMLHLNEQKKTPIRWASLQRSGSNSRRFERENLFYPIFFDKKNGSFISVGASLPLGQDRNSVIVPEGQVVAFPLGKNNDERTWQLSQETFLSLLNSGYIKFGNWQSDEKRTIWYLSSGLLKQIESGEIQVIGFDENGTVILNGDSKNKPLTVWNKSNHSASEQGSSLISNILSGKRFPFPKSLYATHDSLWFYVANNPNALIVDFFAGSGTTLHSVNLLNAEDGGHRRCILVTNNEVSDDEAVELRKQKLRPGDINWEKLGIARYVTWPRTKCTILGVDVKNRPLEGGYITINTKEISKKRQIKQLTFSIPDDKAGTKIKKQIVSLLGNKLAQSLVTDECKYIVSEDYPVSILFNDRYLNEWIEELDGMDNIKELYVVTQDNKVFKQAKSMIDDVLGEIVEEQNVTIPMSEGFKANAQYFKLGFLDKREVALDRQFRELLPLLWMKAGSVGACPKLDGCEIPAMLILPENKMAVLVDESYYADFERAMQDATVDTVFIITDSEIGYKSMAANLKVKNTYQLYRDYLENFSINRVR